VPWRKLLRSRVFLRGRWYMFFDSFILFFSTPF
jgi:hypothetical protein